MITRLLQAYSENPWSGKSSWNLFLVQWHPWLALSPPETSMPSSVELRFSFIKWSSFLHQRTSSDKSLILRGKEGPRSHSVNDQRTLWIILSFQGPLSSVWQIYHFDVLSSQVKERLTTRKRQKKIHHGLQKGLLFLFSTVCLRHK